MRPIEPYPLPTRAASPIYTISETNRELRQSEIVTNLQRYDVFPETGSVEAIPHPFAIILSQDCDLTQDMDACPYLPKAGCSTIAGSRRTRAAPAGIAPVLSW